MDANQQAALEDFLLTMADDELVLGHRDAEWCGHAPIVEEDIAFANIALDEIGHAQQWYTMLADLRQENPDSYTAALVYQRDWQEFRCAQLVTLPKGDWAFSMLRQYLFDAAENARLGMLAGSSVEPLAQTARKVQKEEVYHLRHTQAWVRRLGLGTEESHNRLQAALDQVWQYTGELFTPFSQEGLLASAGIVPPSGEVKSAWEAQVTPLLAECELALPASELLPLRREAPSPFLRVLVTDMQSVARLDPQASW